MTHRKGNRIRAISDEELARQACDLWDKFEHVRIMARFLTLHDELDRRHGGGAQFINAEKKRRNAIETAFKAAGFGPGGALSPIAETPATDDEIEILKLATFIRKIETTVHNHRLLQKTSHNHIFDAISTLCRRALRNHPTQGKPDARQDVSGRKS